MLNVSEFAILTFGTGVGACDEIVGVGEVTESICVRVATAS